MKLLRCLVFAFVFAFLANGAMAQSPPAPQCPDEETLIAGATPTVSVWQLIDQADFVVHGVIANTRTEWNAKERLVSSIHTATVSAQLDGRRLAPGSTGRKGNEIEVEQIGGEMMVDGCPQKVRDSMLPVLEVNRSFLLILRRVGTSTRYRPLVSTYGVHDVRDGKVWATTEQGRSINADIEGMTLGLLAQRLAERQYRRSQTPSRTARPN